MPDELIGRSALIAVIGAGTMGAGIAQVAAVAGGPGRQGPSRSGGRP